MNASEAAGRSPVQLLRTAVQHYDWGSRSVIPRLVGSEPDGRPWAELWVGAHPGGPSRLAGDLRRLDEVVAANPVGELGPDVADRFGRFPFLLKLLAAARPLSLQTHPSAEQAELGFAREEAVGLARDAPERTYRDDWAKPEIACALTDFSALSGFRPVAETAPVLRALDRGDPSPGGLLLADIVGSLLDPPGDDAAAPDDPGRLAVVLRSLLNLGPADGGELARATVAAAGQARRDPRVSSAVLAELALLEQVAAEHPSDPGLVVVLLLNHIVLTPGQALFTPAGVLHAYLSGTAVELMASSDNVVRGGLTGKYVDVAELRRVLDTRPGPPRRIDPVRVGAAEQEYPVPAPQFRLSRLDLPADRSAVVLAEADGPQLLLCTSGAATVTAATVTAPVRMTGGAAAYLPHGTRSVTVAGDPGPATVFRARVGDPQH